MTYKYKCPHEDCAGLAMGVRKCKSCGIVIITNGCVKKL